MATAGFLHMDEYRPSTVEPSEPFGQVADRGARLYTRESRVPSAPNEPSLPSTNLRPGERYRETIVCDFSNTEEHRR